MTDQKENAMSEQYGCPSCLSGWTCESHPGTPWPHPEEQNPELECIGPGMPCANGCLKIDSHGVPALDSSFTETWRREDLQP